MLSHHISISIRIRMASTMELAFAQSLVSLRLLPLMLIINADATMLQQSYVVVVVIVRFRSTDGYNSSALFMPHFHFDYYYARRVAVRCTITNERTNKKKKKERKKATAAAATRRTRPECINSSTLESKQTRKIKGKTKKEK